MMAELKNKEHYRRDPLPADSPLGLAFLLWYIKNSTCDVVYSDYIRPGQQLSAGCIRSQTFLCA